MLGDPGATGPYNAALVDPCVPCYRSHAVPRAFRRNDWMIGLAVVAAVMAATVAGMLHEVEGRAYDLATRIAGEPDPGDEVLVVAIDDASLERIGAWPWSRYTLGEINALIARGDPRVTGYTLPLEEPQNEHAQDTLRGLFELNRDQLTPDARELFQQAIRQMGTDRVLAASFERSGDVVIGARYSLGAGAPASLPALPASMARHALRAEASTARGWPDLLHPYERGHVARVYPPVEQIGRAASGIALAQRTGAEAASTQRALPLALAYDEAWLPSLPLLLYAHARNADPGAIRVTPGRNVTVGDERFETDPGMGVYPAWYGRSGNAVPFEVVSAAAVQAREVPPATFRDRVVLVGVTAPSLADPVDTPTGSLMPVTAAAHQVASLLQGHLYRVPEWALGARAGAFALVALYLMFLLPRLRLTTALAVTVLLAAALANAELLAMTLRQAWLPLMAPLVALVLGHAVLGGKRVLAGKLAEFQVELARANRELGDAYRREGRLDEAFARLQRAGAADETVERVYELGLDYERRRRFARAAEVFQHCRRLVPRYRDTKERITRNKRMQDSVVLGHGGNGGGTKTLVVEDGGVQNPMLGRYQLVREIGKGAMGTVYQGRDPKIGREVAIKTLALDAEFEAESLQDIKARFLREAETAGRLNHPNIVTIHDVGEEQDLVWIAMDYLGGTPMSEFTDADALLPPSEVFEVLAQVADALESAHESSVVHRDVKPDNIIYDREQGKATVTDFGVAFLVDQTHTRSGTILGSPSYMSPEQVEGYRVDGRSDQFSLGITLYQLLTGELPFTGDSISNLMYRIAHERHREIRRVKPKLPACAATITNRAMEKDPERRYASAEQLAQALRRCGQGGRKNKS